ncbi:hypothetical protein [Acutalibacter sp. 1XD8-36]|jgi:hypothetical protein|uniref:hypothetical protein n=1 Tax=Acutalibacter sp. 1XD8-36 TaxID=2320852 RepID=UPI00141225ED|nr:hypothetical protein [Acutalibacter sp. 1XD8-36]
MEPTYRYSESTVRPEQVQISGDTVYLRKDIKESKREDMDGGTVSYWTYQEAAMSTEEFNRNSSALLLKRQLNSDGDMLAIMEAMADMYDVLAMLME